VGTFLLTIRLHGRGLFSFGLFLFRLPTWLPLPALPGRSSPVPVPARLPIQAATLARRDIGQPKLDIAHRAQDVVLLLPRQITRADHCFDARRDARMKLLELDSVYKFATQDRVLQPNLVGFLSNATHLLRV
jgi:hypothetical protein